MLYAYTDGSVYPDEVAEVYGCGTRAVLWRWREGESLFGVKEVTQKGWRSTRTHINIMELLAFGGCVGNGA